MSSSMIGQGADPEEKKKKPLQKSGFFFEVPLIKIAHFPINRIYLWENEPFLLWASKKKCPFKYDG